MLIGAAAGQPARPGGRGVRGQRASAILAAVGSLFTALYPRVLPSTTSPAFSLTTANAAAAANTLAIMTVVACIFLPLVLAYQAWTYWVFRKRVSAPPRPPGVAPVAASAADRPARRAARRPGHPEPAAGTTLMRPLDPRLLRYASGARVPVGGLAGLGVLGAGLTIAQAWLLADRDRAGIYR